MRARADRATERDALLASSGHATARGDANGVALGANDEERARDATKAPTRT
jgi:hypothetical protein